MSSHSDPASECRLAHVEDGVCYAGNRLLVSSLRCKTRPDAMRAGRGCKLIGPHPRGLNSPCDIMPVRTALDFSPTSSRAGVATPWHGTHACLGSGCLADDLSLARCLGSGLRRNDVCGARVHSRNAERREASRIPYSRMAVCRSALSLAATGVADQAAWTVASVNTE